MIEIFGSSGTSERAAAEEIAAAFERTWPGLAQSPPEVDHVKILASAKLSGYRISDIDIVIAARFNSRRFIAPKVMFTDREGTRVAGARVRVESLVAAVEVKDHDSSGLRIEAGGVTARYPDGWSSATDQNDKQLYALKSYLRDKRVPTSFMYRCVLLRGIPELPKERGQPVPAAGAVASNFTTDSLLMAMAGVNGLAKVGGDYLISSGRAAVLDEILSVPLFSQIVPSALDRQRMDRIASRPALAVELGLELGARRVHLRGHGGTGKTVLLLQSAHEAYTHHAKRCLVLTYNHALAADIQRLLALLQIPSWSDGGGVDVRTVMSFMHTWLSRLGLPSRDSQDDEESSDYEARCREALDHIKQGTLTDADIRRVRSDDRLQFGYDAILIDEAQDWPQAEADLLSALYGSEAISIAYGAGQLVRGAPTDWTGASNARRTDRLEPLDECLRMKANLSRFANEVAAHAGLNWKLRPSSQARGGRVIVARSSYAQHAELRRTLMAKAVADGNMAIDCLHCVPPSDVMASGNQRASRLAGTLASEGRAVWDGTDPDVRKDYPRSPHDHRVVQYQSCRGLEGWVTVLDGLDEFWESKYREELHRPVAAHDAARVLAPEERAARAAWRWVMIALTRPIDTLVITLTAEDSTFARSLISVARSLPDFVELV
jgi:hypothetical protein